MVESTTTPRQPRYRLSLFYDPATGRFTQPMTMPANFQNLYLLGTGHLRGALHVKPVDVVHSPFALLRGEEAIGSGFRFARVSGKSFVDLVGTTLPPLVLISNRLRDVLTSQAITGWTAVPVGIDVETSNGGNGYSLLVVSGRSGPVDDSLSERTILSAPPDGESSAGWRGLYFDPDSWDGADMFVPINSRFICLTRRAKDVYHSIDASNCRFERLDSIERLAL